MPTAQYGVSLSVGGVSIQKSITRSGDGSIGVEATIPVAKTGTLTARTDANTGEVTAQSSHGIVDGDIVDIYWAAGARYGMTVGTVATNVVPVDGGSGTDLPSTSTTLTITKRTTVNVTIDGDNAKILGVSLEYTDQSSTERGYALFEDAAGDDIAALELDANQPLVYDIEGGVTNPFTGDVIATAKVSNSSSSATATLKINGVVDVTP